MNLYAKQLNFSLMNLIVRIVLIYFGKHVE